MNVIIDFANTIFKPIIGLGAAPLMTIILTVIALFFKVKFTKALEGGIKLGIALTGISASISCQRHFRVLWLILLPELVWN